MRATPPFASASGSWCGNIPARGSSTTWSSTAPRCTTSPRNIRSGFATWLEHYQRWAERCGVIPREKILALMKAQGETAFWEEEKQK